MARPARLGAADPGAATRRPTTGARSRSRGRRKLLASGENVDAVLEALSRGLTQKILHGTLAELNAAEGDERGRLAQTVTRLFLRGGGRNPGNDKR